MTEAPRPRHAVFIDPPSEEFLSDRLFDASNTWLNRDGSLLPFIRLRDQLRNLGSDARTADHLRRGEGTGEINHYWSFGLIDGRRELSARKDVRFRGFMLFEPPLVAPRIYRALPEVTRAFEAVYLHNTEGEGYSLSGVDASRLRKLRWPLPYSEVVESLWGLGDRQNKVVVVSRNHNPKWRRPELYSRRIEAMAALSRLDAVDLYGHGWDRWWSRESMWPTYWLNRRRLMSIYRGTCDSKLEVLSRYRFCLCLENAPMAGYLTEKLFDCLYAGTVPLYLGAPDIERLVPAGAFVDIRKFAGWSELWEAVRNMPDLEWRRMREAGRDFLHGPGRTLYFNALSPLLNVDSPL